MNLSWATGLLAVGAAGLMGFAIQRGGTCTVAAVEEILNEHSARRLLAVLEASLWVAGGLLLAQWAQLMGSRPAAHAVGPQTVAGGVLLGLGAWVNGACVFGAVARLGSGQWAQALMPVGFFLGCLSVIALVEPGLLGLPGLAVQPVLLPAAPASATSPTPGTAAMGLSLLFVGYALWRVGPGLLRGLRGAGLAKHWAGSLWAPHAATIVIGVTFVATLLLAGPWAYTDVLIRLAQGLRADLSPGTSTGMRTGQMQVPQVPQDLILPALLFAALFAGALAGGWSAGLWRHTVPTRKNMLRCIFGGALMGWGSLLIPGSNDGLLLIGVPLLMPHAWLALTSMVLAIATAMALQRAWPAMRA